MDDTTNNIEQESGRAGERESSAPPASADPATPPQDDAAAKAEEYLAGWQRAKADYANLQRDADAKLADLRKYAGAAFVHELLPVIDTFRKAMEKPPECTEDAGAKQWVEGIGHIRAQLEKVLAKAGVAVIDQAGTPFDPMLHEAMLQQPAEGAEPGSVVQILEPGYRMHDRVLRPAKVVVAE